MPSYPINKQYANQEIRVPVQTQTQQRIVCRAFNPTKANTVYFEAAPLITGYDGFVIKIPNMPDRVIVEIYNEKNGNSKNGDTTFKIGNIKSGPIIQTFAISKILDADLNRFSDFINDFAENAAILSTQPGIYYSDNYKFRIDFLDVIRDDDGKELTTPFRVNSRTRVIQASKKYIVPYTVPGRKMWLWHEFWHVFKNIDPSNEFEADKGAIMMYLGTGNPIVEAYNVTYQCFKNSPSDMNKQRYIALNKYINNFYSNNKLNNS